MSMPKKRRPDSTLKKTAARVAAIQVLYELVQNPPDSPEEMDAIITEKAQNLYKIVAAVKGEESESEVRPDPKMLRAIVDGVLYGSGEIMPELRANLPSAESFERLGPLLSAVLRAGAFELQTHKSVPYKVIIDEYTNISAAFFNDYEAGLVTAVLDKLARK